MKCQLCEKEKAKTELLNLKLCVKCKDETKLLIGEKQMRFNLSGENVKASSIDIQSKKFIGQDFHVNEPFIIFERV